MDNVDHIFQTCNWLPDFPPNFRTGISFFSPSMMHELTRQYKRRCVMSDSYQLSNRMLHVR